jgi:hypothetical protein
MHPLMNRFNTDAQRHLALLGVKESIAPLASRRVFLKALASGLSSVSLACIHRRERRVTGRGRRRDRLLAPNAFIRVGTDNRTVICKHHEMGQQHDGSRDAVTDSSMPTGRWCAPSKRHPMPSWPRT